MDKVFKYFPFFNFMDEEIYDDIIKSCGGIQNGARVDVQKIINFLLSRYSIFLSPKKLIGPFIRNINYETIIAIFTRYLSSNSLCEGEIIQRIKKINPNLTEDEVEHLLSWLPSFKLNSEAPLRRFWLYNINKLEERLKEEIGYLEILRSMHRINLIAQEFGISLGSYYLKEILDCLPSFIKEKDSFSLVNRGNFYRENDIIGGVRFVLAQFFGVNVEFRDIFGVCNYLFVKPSAICDRSGHLDDKLLFFRECKEIHNKYKERCIVYESGITGLTLDDIEEYMTEMLGKFDLSEDEKYSCFDVSLSRLKGQRYLSGLNSKRLPKYYFVAFITLNEIEKIGGFKRQMKKELDL